MHAINGSKALFRYFFLLAFLAVPVSARAQGENKAEKRFKAVEKKLTEAKTLAYTSISKVPHVKRELEIGFVLGKKGKYRVQVHPGSEKDSWELISDGKFIFLSMLGVKERSPEDAREIMSYGMTRLLPPILGSDSGSTLGMSSKEIEKAFVPFGFSTAGKEKVDGRETVLIQYQIKVKGFKAPHDCTLWIDKESGLPVKRKVRMGKEPIGPNGLYRGGLTIREAFRNVAVNEEVDEAQFEIPELEEE